MTGKVQLKCCKHPSLSRSTDESFQTVTWPLSMYRLAPDPTQSQCESLSVLHTGWKVWKRLASFPGRSRNGLATSASSNCIRMWRHSNRNISFQQSSARDIYNFSSCENGAFLLVEATVCCRFYYWSEMEVIRTKIVIQRAYTSAIERSLLNWNGCDCDGSMHYAIGFTVVIWLRSKIWLVVPTFKQRK